MESNRERNPFASIDRLGRSYPLKVVKIRKEKLLLDSIVPTHELSVEYTEYLAETQQKTFLCTDNSTQLKTIMYQNLTVLGRELLTYIQLNLVKDHDSIKLPSSEISNLLNWRDREKIAKAKIELANANIIARMIGKEEYWINPYYLFSGDRKTYYQINYPNNIQIVKVNTQPINSELKREMLILVNRYQ